MWKAGEFSGRMSVSVSDTVESSAGSLQCCGNPFEVARSKLFPLLPAVKKTLTSVQTIVKLVDKSVQIPVCLSQLTDLID